MTILDELIALVDSLDEDENNYQNVRAIKRITHNLAKIQEGLDKTVPTTTRPIRLPGGVL